MAAVEWDLCLKARRRLPMMRTVLMLMAFGNASTRSFDSERLASGDLLDAHCNMETVEQANAAQVTMQLV
eukprot:6185926-Pleurochrysis_carterae.AAC.4